MVEFVYRRVEELTVEQAVGVIKSNLLHKEEDGKLHHNPAYAWGLSAFGWYLLLNRNSDLSL